MKENKTLMQYFEWYLRPENKLWNKAIANAQYLSAIGITDVWLPPAYKGAGGKYDVGYSAYDLYDLGEFDQKGSIETKYGTKEEYINAIKKLHENGIRVYADIVLNHKIGADEPEIVYASEEEHGQYTILKEEITNIQTLNGIIIILMEQTGMKVEEKMVCFVLVVRNGIKM